MTPLTIRWIRVVAIVINVLAFVRELALLTVFGQTVTLSEPPVQSSVWVGFGLSLMAPILAIVAIVGLTRTADSRMVGAATSS